MGKKIIYKNHFWGQKVIKCRLQWSIVIYVLHKIFTEKHTGS